ncbi:hypothetical protein ABKW28_10745 [Nocardioides sp. 31GB23]|uniref:hypothetical protein n=1 Tax=Nocardioides sp. 31GB23 TaxID=3156065 RepID=UPI0032AFD4D2
MDITMTLLYVSQLEALGVAVPEQTQTARAVYEAAGQAAEASPSDDLRAAMMAGELTPANAADRLREAALAESARSTVQTLARDLHLPINRTMLVGLEAEATRIHADLAALFAPAAAEVMESARHFGADVTGDQAIAGGPKVVKLYQSLSDNTALLAAVSRAYQGLLENVTRNLTTAGALVSLYVEDQPDLDLEHARQLFAEPQRWMELAAAGYTLTLNTHDQARALTQKHAARVADEEKAARDSRRSGQRFAGRLGAMA